MALNLARALELQANRVLRQALSRAPEALRWHNVEGQTRDLCAGGSWTLGTLADAIAGDSDRVSWLRQKVRHGRWFTESLPPILREVANVRNPAAHGAEVARDEVIRMRARMVGVGCNGALVELAGVVLLSI